MCVCARARVCVYARACIQASVKVVSLTEGGGGRMFYNIKVWGGDFSTPMSSREIIIMSAGVKTTTLLPQLFAHRNPSRRYNCEVITACVRHSVSVVGLLLSELHVITVNRTRLSFYRSNVL